MCYNEKIGPFTIHGNARQKQENQVNITLTSRNQTEGVIFASNRTTPNPSHQPKRPNAEDILRGLGFGECLKTPPLNLTMITDNAAQSTGFTKRSLLAGDRFRRLMPIIRPRVVAQYFFDVEEIHRSALIEKASPEATGLSLLVLLCKVEPADLVLGVGEQGQPLVADLRREAAKIYPNQVQKFVTQTELEQAARGRPFAGEPDAFLLIALERLYKTHPATT